MTHSYVLRSLRLHWQHADAYDCVLWLQLFSETHWSWYSAEERKRAGLLPTHMKMRTTGSDL